MIFAPIVYLGPSLPAEEARALFPGAVIRPPIERGDLYRDRILRHSLFVIVDGVFFHKPAVPPREIVDVLEDGAVVIGASSMGALRAAECWPAGMRGVGIVYRLFRAGRLASDDEVALAFDPDDPRRALSVPLVNVRHALSRAVRARRLSRAEAEGAVAAAARLHYADRAWPRILRLAGLKDDGALARFLAGHDVKRDDAVRAIRRAAAMLAQDPGLAAMPPRRPRLFVPAEASRERPVDALAGADPHAVKRAVCRHLLASGRYTRHLPALLLVHRLWPDAPGAAPEERGPAATLDDAGRDWLARRALPAEAVDRFAAHRRALDVVWESLGAREEAIADALWEELARSGELDAAVLRWRALAGAVAEGRARGWAPGAAHRHVAEREIAHAHGFPGWPALAEAIRRHAPLWSWVTGLREDLALAKRVKEAIFEEGLAWRGLAVGHSAEADAREETPR